ncbi:MAG: ImmA/IrrE family metallo-endopeptidase [Acidobacteria bacterium]|nr:ImmA/IrrE family metallo-endopeptidase [Acidobacteriota bacterium]
MALHERGRDPRRARGDPAGGRRATNTRHACCVYGRGAGIDPGRSRPLHCGLDRAVLNYVENLKRSLSLDDATLATLAGVDVSRIREWEEDDALPGREASLLADATGIPIEALIGGDGNVVPPMMWKKDREGAEQENLVRIAHARLIGARFVNLMALIRGDGDAAATPDGFQALLGKLRSVAPTSPVADQARLTAEAFTEESGFGVGPVGELLRPWLRSKGFVVLEMGFKGTKTSKVEGLLTYVTTDGGVQRPLIIANSYGTSWARRNYIILHELAHAIHDWQADGSSIVDQQERGHDTAPEERADEFAIRVLVSERLLRHLGNGGLALANAGVKELAALVRGTHAEVRHIVRAGQMYDLIDEKEANRLLGLTAGAMAIVGETDPHALSLDKAMAIPGYVKIEENRNLLTSKKRRTVWPIPNLVLPIPFVSAVRQAWRAEKISARRAAELLMISSDEFTERHIKAS